MLLFLLVSIIITLQIKINKKNIILKSTKKHNFDTSFFHFYEEMKNIPLPAVKFLITFTIFVNNV